VAALTITMKARIGPHSEHEPLLSLKEPCNGDSGNPCLIRSESCSRPAYSLARGECLWTDVPLQIHVRSLQMITRLSPRPVRSVTT
jgi:hypothetical protein